MESLLVIMKWVSSGVYLAVMLPFRGNHLLSFKITLMHNLGNFSGEFHTNCKKQVYESLILLTPRINQKVFMWEIEAVHE